MAALDPQIAAISGIRSAAKPPIGVLAAADQLRRARRREPGWWAAADKHEERVFWRTVARNVRERLLTGIVEDSAAAEGAQPEPG